MDLVNRLSFVGQKGREVHDPGEYRLVNIGTRCNRIVIILRNTALLYYKISILFPFLKE